MRQVTIHEAKAHLSKLIKDALNGEEIIIAKGKNRLIRLEVLADARPVRRIGGAQGVVVEMADDFDATLEDFKDYL